MHLLDNLGGRLGSFDRLEKELPAAQAWSAFDRALGAGAFFGFAGAGASATDSRRRGPAAAPAPSTGRRGTRAGPAFRAA